MSNDRKPFPPFPTVSFADIEPDTGPFVNARGHLYAANRILENNNPGEPNAMRAAWRIAAALGELLPELDADDRKQVMDEMAAVEARTRKSKSR